ncbi:DUF262 domain-containing protein [Marinifilum sp. D714]|uniref:DUF262 domain-containing protein n=1 Tax=Marinifilum sp. D714 TaxID=2937523 RepID=UPI0027D17EBD|nr:DUF262 domain-containing protein [Marinifilum sp. D714]MDQ2178504.1 DUF262 domain-containing HNH endonuclease family protein [Marinifilum sp. D714]
MKANEINLNRFLSQSDTQFIIPVYQRNYDWTSAQCLQLFEDIIEVGTKNEMNAHFIGSIVYVHDDVYHASGIRELSIIDGQQRLTTVTLLYVALFAFAEELGNEALKNRINETYLINKFAQNEEKLKLRPTENNDLALKFLLRNDKNEEFKSYSRLIENYDFFKKRIDSENLDVILKGLSKLMFVEISLDRDKDDPQRIFESLNSTGLELSQADLIRNYILMSLSRVNQIKIYEKYWEVIENNAKIISTNTSEVSSFVRDFLTLENKKIPNKSKVYQEFKLKYPTSTLLSLEENLAKLKKLVKHYNKILNPINEPNKLIRKHLEYINRLEVNVSYPFLMQVYDDYENDIVTKEEFIEVLEIIQSFAWRRFIIGLGTNALNKIFMTLYSDIDTTDYIKSLEFALLKKRGSQRFPSNNEVLNTLKEKDIYSIKSKNRLYFLEKLENHNNKEYVQVDGNSNITIEHIFPQNPDDSWFNDLTAEEMQELKENYLNTMANLTLSGNNGSLGNQRFLNKKNMNKDGGEQGYRYSRLWLNRYLSEIDVWNVDKLMERHKILSKRFIEIWRYPELPTVKNKEDEINIFEVQDSTGKKLDYAILFDQKLVFHTISDLYLHLLKTLLELQPETFFSSDLHQKLQLSKSNEGMRRGIELNDTYFVETNLSNENKIGRMKLALEQFGFDDELYIKWREDICEKTLFSVN